MIKIYHNYKLQTNPWHREEEPQNNHETPRRQTKQSNQLSLPLGMIVKLEWTQRNAQKQTNIDDDDDELEFNDASTLLGH